MDADGGGMMVGTHDPERPAGRQVSRSTKQVNMLTLAATYQPVAHHTTEVAGTTTDHRRTSPDTVTQTV
jgi:hypothetical protein